jgi:regulator of telomere elongation helicase 1
MFHPRSLATTRKEESFSYWCFAPSLAMQELSNLNIRSIIVTSGTLSPLPSYTLELGLPFPHTLENPHIIADEQIHVRVIGTGVSGKQLSSSFNRRDDSDYLDELGCTIVNLAEWFLTECLSSSELWSHGKLCGAMGWTSKR